MKKLFLALLIIGKVFALPTDKITIYANSTQKIEHKRTIKYSGDVVVTKGNLTIYADSGIYSDSAVTGGRVLALSGNPAHFTFKDYTGKSVSGNAKRISYAGKANLIVLTPDAVLSVANKVITGQAITYNLLTGKYSVQVE